MKFLEKFEDTINNFLEKSFEKIKGGLPPFVFDYIAAAKNLPQWMKKNLQSQQNRWRITFLKIIGYSEHYTTLVRGKLMSVLMYLRSDEFKKADKKELFLAPLRFAKFHPIKAMTNLALVFVLFAMTTVIYKNAEKIVTGTKALRKPASVEVEVDNYVHIKNHKFEVKLGGGSGGHGGESAEAHEKELYLDVQIEAKNETLKTELEKIEDQLDESLEYMDLPVKDLPLTKDSQRTIEEYIAKELNEDLNHIGLANAVKAVTVKQVLPGRPVYYRQIERMLTIEEINLQLFLEDTKRNKQIWLDFSVLASNRNVILYLKDHDVELKDHLSTNVEPVIPQLPIEEEGRQIIKDKIKSEINQFLEKNHIEGKIQEVYIDYLVVS